MSSSLRVVGRFSNEKNKMRYSLNQRVNGKNRGNRRKEQLFTDPHPGLPMLTCYLHTYMLLHVTYMLLHAFTWCLHGVHRLLCLSVPLVFDSELFIRLEFCQMKAVFFGLHLGTLPLLCFGTPSIVFF